MEGLEEGVEVVSGSMGDWLCSHAVITVRGFQLSQSYLAVQPQEWSTYQKRGGQRVTSITLSLRFSSCS